MAGLIVPGVARFTVNGDYAGVPVANVLDMHIDSGLGDPRDANVEDQAHVIVSNWADHVCPLVSQRYSALNVSWVDQNDSDGSTGVTALGTGSDFPQAGASGAAAMPGSVAFVVKKNIVARRGSRQGRMFLVGMDEDTTTEAAPNTVIAASIAAINVAMADFLTGINQNGGYESELVVVHTKNTGTTDDPVIEYVGRSHVDSLTCDPKVHTQRRRLGL